MLTEKANLQTGVLDLTSETTWVNLIPSLDATAHSLAYSYSNQVPCWQGQEEDLAQDIVQETALRMIERARRAERGEAEPVHFRKMITTTAQNYCKDLRRRDCRLLRWQSSNADLDELAPAASHPRFFDAICERLDHERLLAQVAQGIVCFPHKQRTALLIDLANRMSFDDRPGVLQRAFREAGVELKHYVRLLPNDQRARSQHTSLLNHALRRVARLPCVQEYITGVKQKPPARKTRKGAHRSA